MNHEQLMKFTLRQMEMKRKSPLKSKKTLSKYIGDFCKTLVVGSKSKSLVKGEVDND